MARWIPVTERLPEDDRYVLVSAEPASGAYIPLLPAVGFYDRGRWIIGDTATLRIKVVAWMPLPKPYRESEDCNVRIAENPTEDVW